MDRDDIIKQLQEATEEILDIILSKE